MPTCFVPLSTLRKTEQGTFYEMDTKYKGTSTYRRMEDFFICDSHFNESSFERDLKIMIPVMSF